MTNFQLITQASQLTKQSGSYKVHIPGSNSLCWNILWYMFMRWELRLMSNVQQHFWGPHAQGKSVYRRSELLTPRRVQVWFRGSTWERVCAFFITASAKKKKIKNSKEALICCLSEGGWNCKSTVNMSECQTWAPPTHVCDNWPPWL